MPVWRRLRPERRSDGYDAFVSYSHAVDGKFAPALQTGLHRFAKPWYRLRALRVFRDETSLSATPELWPSIVNALDRSRWLILLASPEAAESKWVNDEIAHWCATEPKATKRIIVVVTKDEQQGDFDWQRTQAVPSALRQSLEHEPRVVDLRWARGVDDISLQNARFRDAVADVAAPVHGREKDELLGEDVRLHRRTRRVVAAAVVLLAAFASAAVLAAILAVEQRNEARAERDVARSRELAARSTLQLPVDPAESLRLAVDAARAEPTVEAERALRRALSVPVGVVVERQSSPLRAAAFSPNGKLVVTAGEDGKTRVREIATGALVALLDNRSIELVDSVSFSRDGRFLLAMGEGLAWGWDTTSWKRITALDEGSAQAAAFAPDGRLFFSIRGLTRVWDPATGRTTVALRDPGVEGDTWAFPPTFSRDGELAVTTSGRIGGAAVLWELVSRKIVAVLRGREDDRVTSAAFSPDGRLIVTADIGGATRVWRTGTGKLVAVLRGDSGENRALFSPDGKLVLTSPGTARLWDPENQKPRHVLGDRRTSETRAAVFDPDGKLVVTAGGNGAKVWDVSTGATVASLRGHTGLVNDAAFTPDGALIVTAGDDGAARLWRVPRLAHVTLPDRMGPLARPDFSPDGKLVVTPSTGGNTGIWDARTGRRIRNLSGHKGAVTSARFSADGKLLVTAGVDGTVRVWDASDGTAVTILHPRAGALEEATLSRDGARIVALGRDGSARLLDAGTGRTVALLAVGIGTFGGADFSPEGDLVVTYGGATRAAEVWDAQQGRRVAAVGGADAEVLAATLGPDGRLLAAGLPAVGARLFDLTKKRDVYRLHGDDVGRSAAFSADGKLLVTTGESADAHVWNAETGASIAVLRGHSGPVVAAAFNPGATLIVTAGSDGTTRVWEAQDGASLLVLPGQGYLYSAAFDSGGTLILTMGVEGLAGVYRCDVCGSVDDLIAVARMRLLGRLRT